MAKNYRSSGKRIDVVLATNPVASGKETMNAKIFGIPLTHGIVGQTVSFAQDGVWGLTYSNIGGDATVGVGTFLYWDVSALALSIGYALDDFLVGKIVSVISATDKTYAVQLAPQPQAPRVDANAQYVP
jgi:predicted RecA/RadA family phage recombinase